MYTTTDETGRLNNYATEPDMYLASYPAPEQQLNYLRQGGIAAFLVSILIMTAAIVS